MLLMTLLHVLEAATLPPPPAAERRDVSGDDDDDDDDVIGAAVSRDRDVDASDSELAYRLCSLRRLQQLRTAGNRQKNRGVDSRQNRETTATSAWRSEARSVR